MGQAVATLPGLVQPQPSRPDEWFSFARRNPNLVVGLLIVLAIVLFGLIGPFLIRQADTRTTAFAKDLKPSFDHFLATELL